MTSPLTSFGFAGNHPSFADPTGTGDAPKPRRRLRDSRTDNADGLDALIQKTKSFAIRPDPINIGETEMGAYMQLGSNNPAVCLEGVRFFRKYCCGEGSEERAQRVIEWNILDRLLVFLTPEAPDTLLFETLWILTNIAAGPTAHTSKIVEANFLPTLANILEHPDGHIRTQAAWCIGNIIGDREGYRDKVLQAGILRPLLQIWKGAFSDEDQRREAFRIAMWATDNLCRYRPDWCEMAPVFDVLPNVLMHENDAALLKECCWAIARILHQSGRHPIIDQMITPELAERLVEILRFNEIILTHPILRALINLSSSKNINHVKYIIDANVIDQLEYILIDAYLSRSCGTNIRIFSSQILGNISSHKEFAPLIGSRLCEWLMSTLGSLSSSELKNEAAITLKNLLFHRKSAITSMLTSLNIVFAIQDFMQNCPKDSKLQIHALDMILYLGRPFVDKPLEYFLAQPFLVELHSKDFFELIVEVLLENSSANLEQMDTCEKFTENDDCSDEADSDEEDEGKSKCVGNAFNLSQISPSSSAHVPANSKTKDKICSRARQILFTNYLALFEARVRQAQMDRELLNGFDGMSVSKRQNSEIELLMKEFSLLSPNKDSAIELSSPSVTHV